MARIVPRTRFLMVIRASIERTDAETTSYASCVCPCSKSGLRDVFAEAEEVAVGVAEDELVHLPLAGGERREDFYACGAELGFECGGAVGEVEVGAAGV